MDHRIVLTIKNLISSLPHKSSGWLQWSAIYIFLRICKYFILRIPLFILALPILCFVRIIRPWYFIRIGCLFDRIGPMSGFTEKYLCERDAGMHKRQDKQKFIDLFYLEYPLTGSKRGYNKQLYKMWKRTLCVLPEILLSPFKLLNMIIPGQYMIFKDGCNERDVNNLFERFPSHIKFTDPEEEYGKKKLCELGVPPGSPFVCLLVRDSAYYEQHLNVNNDIEHFRDSDIGNYYLAIQELVRRGYFVIRMGLAVNKPLEIIHQNVIDYAWNGSRNDFLDIYLGSKCDFCIATISGWCHVPYIFRRPIVYTNCPSYGGMYTYEKNSLLLLKKYRDKISQRLITYNEIIERGLAYAYHFFNKIDDHSLCKDKFSFENIELIQNTAEEIYDVVLEMVERLEGTWHESTEDSELQRRFWKIFSKIDNTNQLMHGKIQSRFSALFLRKNKHLLE